MIRHLALILFLAALGALHATELDSLTPAQLRQLTPGKPLVINREVQGQPWPETTIWQLVKCPPDLVAGVFWDSELDPTYLPGCLETRIISRPAPSEQQAWFRLKMPLFLPDEVYVSEIRLIPQNPGSYKITWKVLESIYAKSCTGEILIQPHEGGMSLVRYRNFMVPRSKMAKLLKHPGMKRVEESFQALVDQAETESRGSSDLPGKQRKALQLATGK